MEDYKKTLLINEIDFEMRGNLNQKDSHFIKFWKDLNIYEKLSTRWGEEFILHDGPPYANGDLHVGHALNKILKDFIIRNAALEGKKINWILGWDTHGLPIETEVQKKGIKLSEVGKEKYLQSTKDFAISKINSQAIQFEKFALLSDLSEAEKVESTSDLNSLKNIYLTLQPKFVSKEIEIFHKMFNDQLVYQDLKPVYWSWSSLTALADAEIEYANLESYSIYVKFKHQNDDIYFLIWTTTPWTLPGNVAIAFGKNINYSIVEVEGEKIVIASDLILKFQNEVNKEVKFLSKFNLDKFIGMNAINPLNNNLSKLVYGHHVTTENGTGLVHIAGGHGIDDFLIVKENKLPLIVVVNEKGIMENTNLFDGQFYLKAEPLILEKLNSAILYQTKLIHSYPIDWRTKKPVIYRATKQWFVNLEKIKIDLLKSINNVSWDPHWGKERLSSMIETRSEWCISRQRLWGVPIPIIYDQDNNPIKNLELQKNIEEFFKNNDIEKWQEVNIKELLPSSIPFDEKMRKELDILDVWFDSGSSHYAVLGLKIADIIIEGVDQFRGWFNSSLITSQVIKKQAPYKKVVYHGFVNDGNGEKMSKSKGNVIDPIKIIDKMGADILRLWVASVDFRDNVKISDSILEQISNDYRKIRNTIKFLLSNIVDYKNDVAKVTSEINKIVINDIQFNWNLIREAYFEYNYSKVTKLVLSLISNGSIAYYMDYCKDIVYIEKADSPIRKEAQYMLNSMLNLILYSLAPIIPVTIEEAYGKIKTKKTDSIFQTITGEIWEVSNKEWLFFEKQKDFINKAIEQARNNKLIKRSQEIELDLVIDEKIKDKFWNIEVLSKENLAQILMIGKVNLKKDKDIKVYVKKLDGAKCQRCWNTISFKDMFNEEICIRCNKILN